MLKNPFGLPKSALSKRLTAKIIIYASVLMVLSLALTSFMTWLNIKRASENRFKEIEKSYIDIIETALINHRQPFKAS